MDNITKGLIKKAFSDLIDIFEMRIEDDVYEDKEFIISTDKVILGSLKKLKNLLEEV